MALVQSYEIPGTGLSAPNAYFVVTDVKVQKRMQDLAPPPDESDPTGLTNGGVQEGPEVHWKSGYVATVTVTIWTDKSARDNGKKPVGWAGTSPTDMEADLTIGTEGLDQRCVFMIDMASGESHVEQAYAHLKALDYFAGATED